MEVNGWGLYQYPLFEEQLKRLAEAVERLSITQPEAYKEHPKTKLLATIHRFITEAIPRDPNSAEFRQGDTLGPDNRHWFRAKFHQRYRLFFRFSSKNKVIVYVWVNDEFTLRKTGSRTDAYAVFKSMLDAGDPPRTLEALLKRAREMRVEAKGDKPGS
ncbi:MAG: type II toxin-antitoxin system YhaV family toxin [Candidatus Acidiferrales bacterium]